MSRADAPGSVQPLPPFDEVGAAGLGVRSVGPRPGCLVPSADLDRHAAAHVQGLGLHSVVEDRSAGDRREVPGDGVAALDGPVWRE